MVKQVYVVEKENHSNDVVVVEVSSEKLFEMSGSPHVKRLNVLEIYEIVRKKSKLIEQRYDSTKFEITKKGLKPIKVEEPVAEEI